MRKYRILKSVLCLALVLGMLVGCGAGGSAPAESVASKLAGGSDSQSDAGNGDMELLFDEPTELTVLWAWNGGAAQVMTGYEENAVWQEMEKRTNVRLKFLSSPLGEGQEQYNLIMASGEYPDLIWSDEIKYPGGGDRAISDGNYINLKDYLEYMPNFMSIMESSEEIRKQTYTDQGNIWGFPMVETEVQGAWLGMVARKDWLEEWGQGMPETFDDWEDMLTFFKEEKGATAPLSLAATGVWPQCSSMLAGFDVGAEFYQIDNTVKFGPIEEGYREYLTLMNDWYQKGLIDSDFASRDANQLANFFVSGQAGAWRDGFYMIDPYVAKSTDPNYGLTALPTPVKEKGDTAHIRQTNYNNRGLYMSISSNCKYPEEAVRFIDYLYSQEGYMLCNYGVEGESYELDANNKPTYTDVVTNNPDGFGADVMLQKYALQSGPFNRIWDREMFSYGEDAQNCEQIWNIADSTYVLPQTTLTAEEGEVSASIMGDVNTYVSENTVKFIMGERSLDEFDEYVNQVKAMNIDKVIEVQQAALDRYNAR